MTILLSEYIKFQNDELTHRNIKIKLFCALKMGIIQSDMQTMTILKKRVFFCTIKYV